MLGYSLIATIVVLGVLISIHELGHFLVAKRLGVRVLRFSLGFGKKLVGWKKGETEYQIGVLPLGGYVKLFGESAEEEIPESDASRSFTSQSVSRRAAIVVAGPFMNLLLAFVVFTLVFVVGVEEPSYRSSPPVIGWIEPESPAAERGFQPGDRIVSIDEAIVDTWESLEDTIRTSPNEELDIAFERDGKELFRTLVPRADPNIGAGLAGFQPDIPKMVITEALKGKPAHEAGIQAGDVVLSINDDMEQDYERMRHLIEENPGTELTFAIRRGEETFSVGVVPYLDDETNRGKVGIAFVPGFPEIDLVTKRYDLPTALAKGSHLVLRMTGLTFDVIGKLLTGGLSIRVLGGPGRIFEFAGQAAQSGIVPFLQLMAALSLWLAILNVLPIPVLDGGHLAFLVIESIIGRPVSPRTQEIAYKIGFTILIILMIVVTYNDVARWF
jgi:regulator of sigma E protease